MLKNNHIALIFATTQPPVFALQNADRTVTVVSGPHPVDHSARVVEEPSSYPWVKVRGAELTTESAVAIDDLAHEVLGEGLVPVFVCGDIQNRALSAQGYTTINPAMLVDAPSGGKCAPGFSSQHTLPPDLQREISALLGYPV